MSEFTHFNEQGRARMVDIGDKSATERTAAARTSILVDQTIYEKITAGEVDKGDVLSVAQVAGIMAAKQTSSWIPMCHPLSLKAVDISFEWNLDGDEYELEIEAFVKTKGATGVEMEALTAASATALTVYDMAKALDKGMIIGPTYLFTKTGGKSGDFKRGGDSNGAK
ncbi:Cyclic pyranopterin monophosphate synthase [Lentibacillus sp. JNUCC-1]|uniref:cyclic pyranopterin monophosphate synthase MoaC n=1 Tax=Lentibacillus sp. JNUCC-1 TaxID=2654513 RepID=UPI0012E91E86|nr:cyclic pyranopterin monophosphate synthase MoaC [Lentibacillus sp. JNUCC-1]MUV38521.1 Cyclic pyranopterin monophosphate synthase [Lentibacillus sp. JNUCC-1]